MRSVKRTNKNHSLITFPSELTILNLVYRSNRLEVAIDNEDVDKYTCYLWYSDVIIKEARLSKSTLQHRVPSLAKDIHFAIANLNNSYQSALVAIVLLNRITYKEELLDKDASQVIKRFVCYKFLKSCVTLEGYFDVNVLDEKKPLESRQLKKSTCGTK